MNLHEKLKRMGVLGLIAHAVRVLTRLVFRYDYYLVWRRSTAPIPLPRRRLYQVIPADPASVLLYGAPFAHRIPLFEQRVRQGLNGFFFVDDDGTCHGYGWCSAGRDYYEPYYKWLFRISPSEVYVFDAYAQPARRGTIGPLQAVSHYCDYFGSRGIQSILSATHKANDQAWKFHIHLGFQIDSCLRVSRIFGRPVSAHAVDNDKVLTPEMRLALERNRSRAA